MQSNILHTVERRLEVWVNWTLRFGDFGLGYPHKSLIASLQETGGLRIKTTGPTYPPENPEADQMGALVLEMHQQNKKMAMA